MAGVLEYMLRLRTGEFDNPLRNSGSEAGKFEGKISGMGGRLGSLAAGFAGAGGVITAFTAAVAASNAALEAYAGYDGLVRGLKTLEGTAANTKRRISELRDVAKAPGLGFEEAVQGDIRLRSVGITADLSARSMKAFGNALATVGGGKAQLDGVMLALTQIQAKGVVSAEEINQIAERVPQIRAAMKDAFGTADTEGIQRLGLSTTQFIEGIVAQLERLPQVTGGARNALDNYNDAWAELKVSALEFFQPVSTWFNELASTYIKQATRDLNSLKAALGIEAPGLQGKDGKTPQQKQAEEAAAAQAAASLAAAQAEVDAHNRSVDAAEKAARDKAAADKFYQDQKAETLARANARAAAAEEEYLRKTLTREQQIRREIEALNKQGAGLPQRFDTVTNAGIYEATLRRKALEQELSEILAREEEKRKNAADQAEREAAAMERKATAERQAAADFDLETDILTAKAAGNAKLVAELTKQRDIEQLKLDLMRQQGISEDEALRKAKERVSLEEAANAPRRRGVLDAAASAAARLDRRSDADKARDARLGRDGMAAADRLGLENSARELGRANRNADPGRTRREERAELARRDEDRVHPLVKSIEEKLSMITSA